MSLPSRLIALLAALLLPAAPAAAQPRAPLVLAAASLQEAMTAAADAWARAGHPRPVVSFAASSALARQLLAGAPADLFVSADEQWMDALAARHLLAPGTRADFLGNRLVVVARAGNRVRIPLRPPAALARVLGAGPLAMADPASVPAGRYGKAALEALGAWGAVGRHVVGAESVRAALALVERGAAPLGIVYATDARAAPGLRIAGIFPASIHPPIVYPLARLAASRSAEAEAFRRFLLSRPGTAIFVSHGFTRPLMLSAAEWAIVALSLKVGAAALVVTLPLAFALAWLLARASFPGKILLDALVHLPLVVPPVVTGWLLLLAFAPAGPLGAPLAAWFGISVLFRWTGAAIAAGVMALPLMVRAMRLSIEAVDRRLENAARTLGASPTRVFRTVTLPLSLPGILAGTMLGFARGIGEFGATITFVSNVPGETQTLPLAIYAALQQPGGDALVLRLAGISVALSLAALIVSELLARAQGRALDVV